MDSQASFNWFLAYQNSIINLWEDTEVCKTSADEAVIRTMEKSREAFIRAFPQYATEQSNMILLLADAKQILLSDDSSAIL